MDFDEEAKRLIQDMGVIGVSPWIEWIRQSLKFAYACGVEDAAKIAKKCAKDDESRTLRKGYRTDLAVAMHKLEKEIRTLAGSK